MVLSNATLRELAISMTKFSFGAAVIANDIREIIQKIAEGDMSQAIQSNVKIDTTKAFEIITKDKKYVFPNGSLEVDAKTMENEESQISFLLVMQNIIYSKH